MPDIKPPTQNPFSPGTSAWQTWNLQNGKAADNAQVPVQSRAVTPYYFDAKEEFQKPQDWLDRYAGTIPEEAATTSGFRNYLDEVGPYEGYDWEAAGDKLKEGYKPPEYESADYEKTNYNFADQYQAPDAYQSFQFSQPEIDELSKVQPVADEIWNAKKTEANEDINNQYENIRQRTRDEIIRTGRNPEQAASIMANLDIEEDKARRAEARALAIEQAQQGVGIAQKEQELGLQRSTTIAGMDAATQERMANEMAKTYGMSVDAARYMVENYAKQQTAQAGENKTAYDAANVENKYQYETGTEDARYRSAQDQWTEEQKAAEAEKEWQSRYGGAQDQTQNQMANWQADQAAKIDHSNTVMQGGNAAQTNAAQQSTYYGNLDKKERESAARAQSSQPVTQQPVKVASAQQPAAYTTPKPAAPKAAAQPAAKGV